MMKGYLESGEGISIVNKLNATYLIQILEAKGKNTPVL